MKKLVNFIIFLLFLFNLAPSALAAYPKPQGFVSDFAHVLSPKFKQTEEQKLSDYQKKTTNEIAVVMVDTTGDMAIEDYTQGLADQWKPGVSGKDNGIVILFAMQDHHDRIQIGCGLEGAFTDVQAQDILDGDTKTLMRQGHVDQAVSYTIDQVIADLKGTTPQPCKVGSQQAIANARASTAPDNAGNSDSSGSSFLNILLFLVTIAAIAIAAITIVGIMSGSSGDDDDSGSGFDTGILAGGLGGYALGKASSYHDDDNDSSASHSYGGSSSSSSDDDSFSGSSSGGFSGGFGGFSGGSFSGGGASGGW